MCICVQYTVYGKKGIRMENTFWKEAMEKYALIANTGENKLC